MLINNREYFEIVQTLSAQLSWSHNTLKNASGWSWILMNEKKFFEKETNKE